MKKLFLMAMAIVTVSSVWAQFPDGYLTNETRPDAIAWLPEPPKLTGADFTYDFYYYQWGRELRETGVGELALYDESAPLEDVFGPALGLEMSSTTTPEIMLLVERAVSDAHAANKKVKNVIKRTRPFAQFKEPSLKPEEDEEEAGTYSYPSGHSSRGWMYALILATVAPEHAEMLFYRARIYALNRVICGHHWKTDTDASLMLAAGIFATIVSTDEYQAQLKKAREEYARLKGVQTAVPEATVVQHPAAQARAYTTNGAPATDTTRGVIIQNGQKSVRK